MLAKIFSNKLYTVGLSLVFLLFNLMLYLSFEMRGNLDFLPMTSEKFGVPQRLHEKGIVPFYHGARGGWDGQFYYFIANDLLDKNMTSQFLDSHSYRYQRPGVGVWAWIGSIVLGKDWISPSFYLFSYILLFVVGCFSLASLFEIYKVPLYWVFAWSSFVSTQVTIFNFLPDAGADCFLFIALLCFLQKRKFLSSIAFSFAILSREVYLLVPFLIFLFQVFTFVQEKRTYKNFYETIVSVIPGLVFLAWYSWLLQHFKTSPGAQAHGVFDWPLRSWLYYSVHAPTALGTLSLLSFLFIILIYLKLIPLVFRKNKDFWKWFFVSFGVISAVYLCFGEIVLTHWGGYLKPAAVYLFLIPMFHAVIQREISSKLKKFLFFFCILSMLHLYFEKIISKYPDTIYDGHYRLASNEQVPDELSCLPKIPKVEIVKISEEEFLYNKWLLKLFFRPEIKIYKFKVSNMSNETIPIAKHRGDISLIYHWQHSGGNIKFAGPNHVRLPASLLPNQEITLDLPIVEPNQINEQSKLIVALNQDGCDSQK